MARWHQSMVGAPKGSIPLTSKKPKYCLKSPCKTFQHGKLPKGMENSTTYSIGRTAEARDA
jgi:hypothetical protein